MAEEKLKEIKYGEQKIAVECAKRDYDGNEIASTYSTQATVTDLEKRVSSNTSSISSANKKILALENSVATINSKDTEQDGKFIIQENEINTIKSTAVDLTSAQTISGIKTFSQYVLTDMVCATDQSSLIRKYYRTDTTDYCDVFGTVRYDNVLMGKSTRPFYTSSGSDFKGEEIALLSDVLTIKYLYKHHIVLKMKIDNNNFKYETNIYGHNADQATTLDSIGQLNGSGVTDDEIYQEGIITPTTDTSIYQIYSMYVNTKAETITIVFGKPFETGSEISTTTVAWDTIESSSIKDTVINLDF